MSPFVPKSLFFDKEWPSANPFTGQPCVRTGLELLEDRITPTTVTGLSPIAGPLAGGTW